MTNRVDYLYSLIDAGARAERLEEIIQARTNLLRNYSVLVQIVEHLSDLHDPRVDEILEALDNVIKA